MTINFKNKHDRTLSVHLNNNNNNSSSGGKMHYSPNENHPFLKWEKTAVLVLHAPPVIMVMVNGLI